MKFIGLIPFPGDDHNPDRVVTCSSNPWTVLDLHVGQGILLRRGTTTLISLDVRSVRMDQREDDRHRMKKFIEAHAKPGVVIDAFYTDSEDVRHDSAIMICTGDHE